MDFIDVIVTNELNKYQQTFRKNWLQALGFYLGINRSASFFNKSNKLSGRSGKLEESYIRRTTTHRDKYKLVLDIESDLAYASIHETGGFIKARKTTNSKGRPTYKMAQFFWYKYIKTGDRVYMMMALSVQKKGGVKIPKRSYLTKMQEKFEERTLPRLMEQLTDNIVEEYNAV